MLHDCDSNSICKDLMVEEAIDILKQIDFYNDSENAPISDEDAYSFLNRISKETIANYVKQEGILDELLDELYQNGEIDFIDTNKNFHFSLDATEDQIRIIYDGLINKKFIDKETNFRDFYYACTGNNRPNSYIRITWTAKKNQCAYFIKQLFRETTRYWRIGQSVFNIKLLSQAYSNLYNTKKSFAKLTKPIDDIIDKANIFPK